MDDEHDIDTLDTSWLDLEQEDLPINGIQPTEPLRSLNVTVAYVDILSNLVRVVADTVDLDVDQHDSVLTRARLVEIIKRRRVDNHGRQYRLVHLMLFQVPLPPEQVQVFAKTDLPILDPTRCFTAFSSVQDLRIPPAIFAFHEVYRLYLVFREMGGDSNGNNNTGGGSGTLPAAPNPVGWAAPNPVGGAAPKTKPVGVVGSKTKTARKGGTKRVSFSTSSSAGRHTRRVYEHTDHAEVGQGEPKGVDH